VIAQAFRGKDVGISASDLVMSKKTSKAGKSSIGLDKAKSTVKRSVK